MRKTSLLLKKLRIDRKEFVTADELKAYCKPLGLSYATTIKYFVYRGYLTRIFKGVFYVKALEEVKLGISRYNHLELVAKGLELKDITNWYFGLYTALKLNNMTHEHFAVDYVINNRIFRPKPMRIAGYKFRFIKLTPILLNFGIIGNPLRHSDAEKTVLDFIYTWRYNGIPKEKIVLDVSEWAKDLSGEKTRRYAVNYPKTVQATAEMVLE